MQRAKTEMMIAGRRRGGGGFVFADIFQSFLLQVSNLNEIFERIGGPTAESKSIFCCCLSTTKKRALCK